VIARGRLLAVHEATAEAALPLAAVGDIVRVQTARAVVAARVIAVRAENVRLAPFDALDGAAAGDLVCSDPRGDTHVLGTALLGRAIDANGTALDGGPPPVGLERCVTGGEDGEPLSPDRPLWTGVRAIDALLTIGRGARVGIFAPAGAGKSTLLRAMVRGVRADAVVVGAVGERGREAGEWIAACDARTTVICARGDRPPAQRVRAAHLAVAQACALRAHGLDVLLVLDSLARVAYAMRELAVAAGESLGRGGYPAATPALLARLVERAGVRRSGSVTLIATVLSDGDPRDPVCEIARSLLDGHIELDPALASRGRFPAIAVGASASRTMHAVVAPAHREAAAAVRGALAALDACADLRSVGMMPHDPLALRALAAEEALEEFLRQGPEVADPQGTLSELQVLADMVKG